MNAAISGRLRWSLVGVVLLISAGCVTLESGGDHGPGAVTELNGNVAATEKELGDTSRVLMLDNPQPKAAEPAPAADNSSAPKKGEEQKQVADVAL